MSDVAYIHDPKGNRIVLMDGFGNLSEEACFLYAQGTLNAEEKARIDAIAAADPMTRDALDGLMMMQNGRRTAIAGLKEQVVARTGAQLMASQATGNGLQWLRIAAGIALLITVGIGTYYAARYVQQQQMAVTTPEIDAPAPIVTPAPIVAPTPVELAAVVDSSPPMPDTLLDAAIEIDAVDATPAIATAMAPPQPAPTDLVAQDKFAEEKEKQAALAKAKAALEKQKQAELQRLQAYKLAQQTTIAEADEVFAQQKAIAAGSARDENELANSDVEVKVMPMAEREKITIETDKKSKKKEAPELHSASRNAAKREEQARSMETTQAEIAALKTSASLSDKPVAYDQVQSPPRFPGGDLEMFRFISRNKNYSEEMKKNGVSGNVFVNFVVEQDGRITGINVTKRVNSELDADAKRVMQSMPKWEAAEQDGQPVRTTRTLVIKYE